MHNFSAASERSKQPIFDQLSRRIGGNETILEVGSRSGQHALFFAQKLPCTHWQCSDLADNLSQLTDNIKHANLTNVALPIELDVIHYDWASWQYDVIFTANTLHIMTQEEVDHFLSHVHLALRPRGKLIAYGPFNYQNDYTSASNRDFDVILRQKNMGSCIKSFELTHAHLSKNQFTLLNDWTMPVNNRLIAWELSSANTT